MFVEFCLLYKNERFSRPALYTSSEMVYTRYTKKLFKLHDVLTQTKPYSWHQSSKMATYQNCEGHLFSQITFKTVWEPSAKQKRNLLSYQHIVLFLSHETRRTPCLWLVIRSGNSANRCQYYCLAWVTIAAGLRKEGHVLHRQTVSQPAAKQFRGKVFFSLCFEALCTCEHK